LWLLIAILLSLGWVGWQQGWQPKTVLAYVNQDLLAQIPGQPVPVPNLAGAELPAQAQPQSDTVVMVSQQVVENPHSTAFTADLYTATGKDEIPWPNIDGRTKVVEYTVQPGDSLWGIANQFGLDIDTLRWSNPELERNPDVLSVGQVLNILPVQGVFHIAQPGDTIDDIAVQYGVGPESITDYPPNALFPPFDLQAGQGIIVPFGKKYLAKLPHPAPAPDAELAWPIAGAITQGFSDQHGALDIGAPYGSTVYAAESGVIKYADWAAEGYGFTVIVDHGNGRETWYNHLKGALLSVGSPVERGTAIGQVGSTGHSTGPHVHFEVRVDGRRVNPLEFLSGTEPH